MTLDALLALKPCNPETRVMLFAGRKSMNISQAFESGVSVSDICWLMGKLNRLGDIVAFANFCAAAADAAHYAAATRAHAAAAIRAADDARAARAADDARAARAVRAADAAAAAAAAAHYAADDADDADDADADAHYAAAAAAQKAFLIKLLSE